MLDDMTLREFNLRIQIQYIRAGKNFTRSTALRIRLMPKICGASNCRGYPLSSAIHCSLVETCKANDIEHHRCYFLAKRDYMKNFLYIKGLPLDFAAC